MYILINKSLPMKKGKIALQVGHAVKKITEYCLKNEKELYDKYCANSYAKVILKVPNEEVILKILYELKDIHKSYVVDEGRTQIKPNSLTAIGFIPMARKDIPSCLKQLKLL